MLVWTRYRELRLFFCVCSEWFGNVSLKWTELQTVEFLSFTFTSSHHPKWSRNVPKENTKDARLFRQTWLKMRSSLDLCAGGQAECWRDRLTAVLHWSAKWTELEWIDMDILMHILELWRQHTAPYRPCSCDSTARGSKTAVHHL